MIDNYKLSKEVIQTCKYFKIIKCKFNNEFVEKKIIDGLEDIRFVENLINIFYSKIKIKEYKRKLNIKRIKKLLIELEKVRINLEFKEVWK